MNQPATTKTNTSAPVAIVSDSGPDCDRVNTVLDQLIEGQPVTAEDKDYLYDHADDCSPCFDDIAKQRIFIGFLKEGLVRRSSPASLQQSILARVSAEMA